MKLNFISLRLFVSAALLVGLLYVLMPEVQASGIPYPAPGGVPGASLSSGGSPEGAVVAFAVLLQRITDGVAALAASVAILFVVINGARLTFAFGNTEALGKARKGLIWAAAGLVVIIFAYVIAKTVIALVYSGSDGSAVIGTANLAPTTTTPGTIDPVNDGEIGEDGTIYLPAGQRTLSFFQQGAEREYIVYIPSRLDSAQKHPAVIVLHGGLGDASSIISVSEMNTLANQERFIAVYPESGGRTWNDGRDETASPIDDVAYIHTMLNQLENDWQVDSGQVFVAGISAGGMMTQRLACELTNRIAGAASVAANLPADLNCNPSGPMPIVFINGTDDRLMPFEGGEISSIPSLGIGAGGTVLSFADTMTEWSDNNGCTSDSREVLPDTAQDDTTATKITYVGCTRGALEAFEITGGGHNWPGSVGASSLTGNVSREIDASAEIVEFFKRAGLTPAP